MRTVLRALLLTALALALAACGDDAAVDDAPADEPDDTAAETDGAVVAVSSTDAGEVLTDGEGMTLYLFDPDEQGPSTCYDDCADSWPPLVTEGEATAGEGADEALLGTSERDDGELQVTYDGWPLYYWAADDAPGDATGQGVQDVWWVITADGEPVRDAAEDDSAEDEADDEDEPGSAY